MSAQHTPGLYGRTNRRERDGATLSAVNCASGDGDCRFSACQCPKKPHPTETAEYWFSRARNERGCAVEDRGRRYGSVESIKVHLQQAEEYERRGAAIAKATRSAS